MNNLDDVLRGAFIEQEQQATKSKQIEERIKSYECASALLPSRQYGKLSLFNISYSHSIEPDKRPIKNMSKPPVETGFLFDLFILSFFDKPVINSKN